MDWAPYVTACDCQCHRGSGIANPEAVPVTDVIEAAVACDTCRYLHCPALRDPEPERPPIPPDPADFCSEWE